MSREIDTTLSDQELVDHCEFLIKDFCENGFKSNHWTMRIPAEPNRDPDLVFSELINRFNAVRSKSSNSDYAKCKEAYIDGYESGHNDTVESGYGSSADKADEWISEHFASSLNLRGCAKEE